MGSAVKDVLAGLSISLALAHGDVFSAQPYPDRPIRLVSPFPPAGGVDFVARLLTEKIREAVGQPVIIEHRPGGNGNIAATMVAASAPDGYTLLIASAEYSVNVTLQKNLPYDFVKDFTPVTLICASPQMLLIHPSIPVHSVAQLIKFAKSHPGKLTYASTGIGGASHLSQELFKSMAGVDILHIPYKGNGPAVADLLGGHVDMFFSSVVASMPIVNAGKVRALGVTSNKRLAILEDMPTVAEAGLPGYKKFNWYGFLLPANTPREIVARLNSEAVKALNLPDVKGRMNKAAYEIIANSPQEFATFINEEIVKNAQIIRDAKIKVD